ncbi:MAG: glycosyltransferase family 2 protein [Candidatus Dormibacteraeota bacterium]|uniref:Glycosyltransferase family 2 protein n=1 Tax=Candidatus Amunia macphersoniae TaxID=3127014 RepID=A0A934KK55_9BACT|nr:glycosyltransferase family 2 protein [Candidatus Dormibacteraeota bacterium]
MIDLAFVLAPSQNYFFREAVEAIRHELTGLGVSSSIHDDGFPEARGGRVYVLVPPHEYFRLEGYRKPPGHALLARTIYISMEQPQTIFFHENVKLAPHAGAVFDISARAVRQYGEWGIKARHFPLGYSSYWDVPDATVERDIDVLFMGSLSARRENLLARFGRALQDQRFQIVLSDNSRPNSRQAKNFVIGARKRRLLARSKVLINLHQGREPYFEWVRAIDAIHAGAALVSELSTDHEPLVGDEHFVTGSPEIIPSLALNLLKDSDKSRRLTAAAYELLQRRLPFRRSVEMLADVATALDQQTAVGDAPFWNYPTAQNETTTRYFFEDKGAGHGAHAIADAPRRVLSRGTPATVARARRATTEWVRWTVMHFGSEASKGLRAETRDARYRLKELRLDLLDVRRDLRRVALTAPEAPLPACVDVLSTSAYNAASPRVSVVMPVYNHSAYCLEGLDSVRASSFRDWEIIVVDDGSTDESLETVKEWSRNHDDVPLVLLSHPVNRGLPHTRNAGIERARGECVLMLDADNVLFRYGLARLVTTLDASPSAAFAYGMLSCFPERSLAGWMLSKFPWDPERLRTGNYIDALALFRLSAMRALGGYTSDRRLYGWEDFDLNCRVAEAGGWAAFVPEVVAGYRVSSGSMVSLSNLSYRDVLPALEEHSPTFMLGAPSLPEQM